MRHLAVISFTVLLLLPSVQPAHAADDALTAPITTLKDRPQPSPLADQQEYISYARYWWPDPSKPDGLPYVNHDGRHNHAQVAKGDEPRLGHFMSTVNALAAGYERTHRPEYARRAGDWIRAWMIAPATLMRPNLEYAQVRLGHHHNHGSNSGILDARGFIAFTASLRQLENSPGLTPRDTAAVHAWFASYLNWLLTSANGRAEHAAPNNHGSWFLAQAIAIARYCGRDDVARRLAEEDKARIAHQIRPDGSQPEELRRADALGYSVFNLSAQMEICRQARDLGVSLIDYAPPHAGTLLKAIDYLRPYNDDPSKWPRSQHNPEKPRFLDAILRESAALRS